MLCLLQLIGIVIVIMCAVYGCISPHLILFSFYLVFLSVFFALYSLNLAHSHHITSHTHSIILTGCGGGGTCRCREASLVCGAPDLREPGLERQRQSAGASHGHEAS